MPFSKGVIGTKNMSKNPEQMPNLGREGLSLCLSWNRTEPPSQKPLVQGRGKRHGKSLCACKGVWIKHSHATEPGSRYEKSHGLKTLLIYILQVVFNTASFVCFDNGSYLLVRAVFRTIITLYKSLIVFLSTCSAHRSGIANLIEERSSRESLWRLSPFS